MEDTSEDLKFEASLKCWKFECLIFRKTLNTQGYFESWSEMEDISMFGAMILEVLNFFFFFN